MNRRDLFRSLTLMAMTLGLPLPVDEKGKAPSGSLLTEKHMSAPDLEWTPSVVLSSIIPQGTDSSIFLQGGDLCQAEWCFYVTGWRMGFSGNASVADVWTTWQFDLWDNVLLGLKLRFLDFTLFDLGHPYQAANNSPAVAYVKNKSFDLEHLEMELVPMPHVPKYLVNRGGE